VKRHAEEIFASHGVLIQIRVGINSGGVVVRDIGSDLQMDYTAVGQTTQLASRVEQLAAPGSILLAPMTVQLAEGYIQVTSRGPVPVKGLSEPIEVYEIVGPGAVRSRLHAAAARGLTRFVGRDSEIEQLHQALKAPGRTWPGGRGGRRARGWQIPPVLGVHALPSLAKLPRAGERLGFLR
jgi:hypothetical protein